MTQIPGPGGAEDEEMHVIWRAVERESGSAESIILVVVLSEKKRPVSQMIRRKKAEGKIQAEVVVTTPEDLQGTIALALIKFYRKLFLLAAPSVETITYKVSNRVESVHVAPCQPTTRWNALRIGSHSTYCGVKTYAWALRSEELSSYKIEHGEGCFFDISDDLDEAKRLLGTPGSAPDMTDADLQPIKEKVMEFWDYDDTEPSTATATADRTATTSPSFTPSPGRSSFWRWWDEWKRVVAICVGGATGAAALIWFNTSGIFLKGTIEVAVRWLSMGAVGGGTVVAVGAGLAAGAMVYFIPWEKVITGLQRTLRRIWGTVKEVIGWVWQKIKEMASAVRSAAEGEGVFAPARMGRVRIGEGPMKF